MSYKLWKAMRQRGEITASWSPPLRECVMRIAVTGAAGRLGGQAAEILAAGPGWRTR
jgi:hypothetical protein